MTPPAKISRPEKRLAMMFSLADFPIGRAYWYSSIMASPTSNTRMSWTESTASRAAVKNSSLFKWLR